MFFGIGKNFILAIVVLFFLGLFIDSPSSTNLVSSIKIETPTEISGIRGGDHVINIDDYKISNLDGFHLYLLIATTKID